MRTRWNLALLVFLGWVNASAQVSVNGFIGSALSDPEIKTFDRQVEYLKGKPYRLSPLQKLEFRYQNRELGIDQQEYALRFNPANPWELRNNSRYFEAYQSSLLLEKDMILKEILVERYYLVIDYVYHSGLRELVRERQQRILEQLTILERQTSSSFFDPDEYVELKVDAVDASVELEEIDFERLVIRQQIERLTSKAFQHSSQWEWSSCISVDKVQQVLDSLSRESTRQTSLAYREQKIKLAESEYKLERANMNLGFLQTEFDQRRVEQNRTPVNLSLGITLPVTNPNKGDMAKRKLESIEAELDLEEARQETLADQAMSKVKIEQLVRQYRGLETKITELKQSNLASTLSTLKGGDPLILVRFQQSLIKLETLKLKINRNLLLSYVDYLAATDMLQQQPLINFISSSLEPAAQP